MTATHEENVERCKPWALVLRDMLELVDDGVQLSFGAMIRLCCERRMVPYPPPDVERALLLSVVRRTMAGAPSPKDFA